MKGVNVILATLDRKLVGSPDRLLRLGGEMVKGWHKF